MDIPRNRYVIAYEDTTEKKIHCIMCWRDGNPSGISGWHCPIYNIGIDNKCHHYTGGKIKGYLFDNTKHKIISTLDKCGFNELGCTNSCNTCITWHIVQGDYDQG